MKRFPAGQVAAAAAGAILLGGCVPSDPVLPSAGVRLDGQIVTLLVRMCPGERVVSASVTEMLADSLPPPAWRASGFAGDQASSVVSVSFDSRSWNRATGNYAELSSYSPEVETDQRIYGTVVGGEFGTSLQELRAVPAGKYEVDGQELTARSYLALVDKQVPCATPTST